MAAHSTSSSSSNSSCDPKSHLSSSLQPPPSLQPTRDRHGRFSESFSMAQPPSKSRSRASFYSKLLHTLREAGILSLFVPNNMSPTIGPDLVPPTPLGKLRTTPVPLSRSSTSSSRTNPSIGTSPAYSSSSLSIPFNDDDGEVIKVEGLRHAPFRLEAR